MSSEEAWRGGWKLVPPESKWPNKVLSRIFLKLVFYNPIWFANKISAPTLFIAATEDGITPVSDVEKAAQRIPNAEICLLACDHFQPYVDEDFEKNIAAQMKFLNFLHQN